MDKILKIQSEIGVLSKDKENPFFKSSYFDINSLIAQLQPLLEKYQLTVVQPLSSVDGRPAIRTIVFDNETKSKIVDDAVVLAEPFYQTANKEKVVLTNPDPQKMGSAITYYRRYALQSLFLLQAQDDDGNYASGKKTKVANDDDLDF